MSKWNVKTADGRIADVAVVAKQPSASLLETANPVYSNSMPLGYPDSDLKADSSDSCMHRCGARLENRRCRMIIACALLFTVVLVILAAVLVPRYPTVDIDRSATFSSVLVDKTSLPNNTWRIYGNATIIILNPNVYPISLAGMEVNGTIGKDPNNQVNFYQAIGALDIPKDGTSRHTIPIDFVIPPSVDKQALVSEITLECIQRINKIDTLMSGNARVNFLGTQLSFSFGPQIFTSNCLQF